MRSLLVWKKKESPRRLPAKLHPLEFRADKVYPSWVYDRAIAPRYLRERVKFFLSLSSFRAHYVYTYVTLRNIPRLHEP